MSYFNLGRTHIVYIIKENDLLIEKRTGIINRVGRFTRISKQPDGKWYSHGSQMFTIQDALMNEPSHQCFLKAEHDAIKAYEGGKK